MLGLGIRSGLIQLNNVQAFDTVATDTLIVYSGSATAFQLGWVRGLSLRVFDTPFTLFYERSDHMRRMPGVQWAAAGTPRIPEMLPRTLDFSGATTTIGVQLTIRDLK